MPLPGELGEIITVDEVHVYESRLGGGPDHAGSTFILRSRAALGAAAST